MSVRVSWGPCPTIKQTPSQDPPGCTGLCIAGGERPIAVEQRWIVRLRKDHSLVDHSMPHRDKTQPEHRLWGSSAVSVRERWARRARRKATNTFCRPLRVH